MVEKLFRAGPPAVDAELLDPGCGTGEFIEGVIRWCAARRVSVPRITGVDSDPEHIAVARHRFSKCSSVRVIQADFLSATQRRFDYIIGNPPYVPITALNAEERASYRKSYATARGRFDLYVLFLEQALRVLKDGGRAVFITPEKFLYVPSASPLRELLGAVRVEDLHLLPEDTFAGLTTYPLVSTVSKSRRGHTTITQRNGATTSVSLTRDGASWMPLIQGARPLVDSYTLADVCLRISCGVATGADSVFVLRTSEIPDQLRDFAYQTLAGRQLVPHELPLLTHSMLVPYRRDGSLCSEKKVSALLDYLAEPGRRKKLLARTCVSRKPWYAFHETPPLADILRPKILCKDIGASPFFFVDREGSIVPRHSVYYIVPAKASDLESLASYLNSSTAQQWLKDHCQRAANSFIRLQSHVLKRLPIPDLFNINQLRLLNAAAS